MSNRDAIQRYHENRAKMLAGGGAVYSPAIPDFILMVDGVSNLYITGPDVIRAVTGEEISHDELGSAATQLIDQRQRPLPS